MQEERNVLSYPQGHVPTQGAPKPARIKPLWPLVTSIVSTAVVAGGSFLGLVGGVSTGVRGATRSAQLKWEQREREVDDAIARHQTTQSATSERTDG